MGELLITERQDLQNIANKLKAKIGKTDGMSFPNGFKEAIDNISGEPKLQNKTITENGTYQADNGFDGLGSVTVEVASSGGGSGSGCTFTKLVFDGVLTFYQKNLVGTSLVVE